MVVERRRLDAGHEAFVGWSESNGAEFGTFAQCDALRREEIDYKIDHRGLARSVLGLNDDFRSLGAGDGEILRRVQRALRESANLLQNVIQRYGTDHRAVVAFFHPREHEAKLELLLRDLLTADRRDPGGEFDALCDFLRSVNGFGCQWAPMSYLLFLIDSDRYFPVRAGYFQQLLTYYGVNTPFGGEVTWSRYRVLLDLADVLRDYLSPHEPRHAVDIQSYMYVVAHQLTSAEQALARGPAPRPFDEELQRRRNRAVDREMVGMLGEQYVVEKERERLQPELARKVRAVAWDSDDYGYDIISYEPDGSEIHIEVKSTSRSEEWATEFHLSAHEAEVAEAEGDQWRLYRVTEVFRNPQMHPMGNVVTDPPEGWRQSVSAYCYSRER